MYFCLLHNYLCIKENRVKFIISFLCILSVQALTSQCILKCNLNVGYYSDNDASTIGYDNMGSSFHSTYAAQKVGFLIWGEDMSNAGNTHNYGPLKIDSINYPALTGEVSYVGVGSSLQGNVQMIVLSSQGLFASGIAGSVLSTTIKTSNIFSKLTINGKTDGLPLGLTPDSIKMMFVTHRSIYLTSCAGNVYVLSQDSNVRGTKGLTPFSASIWSKVLDSNGLPLSNVIVTRGQGRFAFALKSDSTIWTWGDSVMRGNGTGSKNLNYAVQMIKPAGIPGIKMIQATTNGYTGTPRVSYYILGTDKKVYCLGANASGQLGDRTSVAKYVWVNAKNPNGTIIDSAIWISSNEHDNSNPNFGVLKSSGQMFTAGNNSGSMIARATPPNFLDTPVGIKNSDTILFFEVGGHTTAFIKIGTPKYGYVGHKVNGSLGNDSISSSTITLVDFGATPVINVCGTTCDTPLILARPYKCSDTQAIFTIKSKFGNKFRYQLNNGPSIDSVIGSGDSLQVIVMYPPVDLEINISQVSSNLCFLVLNNIKKKLTTYSVVDTSISICSNKYYTLGTKQLNIAGTYLDTLTNIRACDSFITVHLSVIPITFDTIDSAFCQGLTMNFNGNTLTKSGVYYDTLVNQAGCDSFITLNLTVYKWDTTNIFDSICVGSNYLFNGKVLLADGIYWDTLVNRYGCDSFIKLDFRFFLTVKSNVKDSFCINSFYNFNSKILNSPGQYRDTFHMPSGCDSIVFLTLDYYNKDSSLIYDSICPVGSIFFNDQYIQLPGYYHDTLVNRHGCDSFIILKLSHYDRKDTTILLDSFCISRAYFFNSQLILTPGIYWDTLVNRKGCDSFIKLILSYYHNDTTTKFDSFCINSSYIFNGQRILSPGIYWDTLANYKGCDSFIKLNLAFYKNDTTILNRHYCQFGFYNFNGQDISTVGTYWDTLINRKGCDSFIILNLTEVKLDTTNLQNYFCEGKFYNFNGNKITIAGIYWDTLVNRKGCDSFIRLDLYKVKKDTTTYSKTICFGKQHILNGMSYSKTGIYNVDTFTNVKGCDSLIILKLQVDTPSYKSHFYYGCKFYSFRSVTYSSSSIIYDTARYINGCDSFIDIHNIVIKNPITKPIISISFCDSILLLGKKYYTNSVINDTIKSKIINCDSIYQTYNLTAYYHVKMKISITPQKDTYHKGDIVFLQTTSASNYLWNTVEISPSISVKLVNDSLCYVIGWNNSFCKDTAKIFLKTNDDATIKVPTAFSPNGDGNNDYLYCRGFGIQKMHHFKVFNRLGQLMFSTNDINQGWDGYYKGIAQNSDTYFYYFEAETYAPTKKVSGEGNFMLLK